jgi:serine O-acetyltransferase
MIDHGTGVVIGETCVIGENCQLLHGVTLGGNGKEIGDRHPKLGDNVIIGCQATILGNIRIGNNSRIGAASMVLKPVPDGATAVGKNGSN